MIRLRQGARVAAAVAAFLCASALPGAHDLERSRVSLTFDADGTFVLDVSNDANWLRLRLEDFAADYPALAPAPDGPLTDAARDARLRAFAPTFADRVVLWANHGEVRATSSEYLPPAAHAADEPPIGTYRLRGRMPAGAQAFQWFYGIVIDPYPLVVRYPDGHAVTQAVLGNAWSEDIDASAVFREATFSEATARRARAVWLSALRGRAWTIVITLVALAAAAIVIGGAFARARR